MVIGVSGVAGVGKDLFVDTCIAELAKGGKSSDKVAIASELKSEVRSWCLEHYGVDALNASREDKEKIREFLVFHGATKRRASDGRHWINLADEAINSTKHNYDYLFVSDVRYDDFEKDEVHWVKKELKGALVHVSQYEIKEVVSKKDWTKMVEDKVFKAPANTEEARNDPKLKAHADYQLSWERTNINKDKYISSKVVQFIEWLSTQRDG